MAEKIKKQEYKVAVEVAANDIKGWLDYKKVKQSKRDAYAPYIATLVEAVMYGDLEVAKDFQLVHNLQFELGSFSKLTYSPRLSAELINKQFVAHGGTRDEFWNTILYAAALTGENSGLLGKVDMSGDYQLMTAIGVFFI